MHYWDFVLCKKVEINWAIKCKCKQRDSFLLFKATESLFRHAPAETSIPAWKSIHGYHGSPMRTESTVKKLKRKKKTPWRHNVSRVRSKLNEKLKAFLIFRAVFLDIQLQKQNQCAATGVPVFMLPFSVRCVTQKGFVSLCGHHLLSAGMQTAHEYPADNCLGKIIFKKSKGEENNKIINK